MLDPSDDEAGVRAILDALESYKAAHPGASITSYRRNSGSIRVRIIDPDFRKFDKAVRHDRIWEVLDPLPEDVLSQITVLLLLTPEEVQASFADMDFENPIPSRL